MGHNLEIANNRIYGNTGTLSGASTLVRVNFLPRISGAQGRNKPAPGSCQDSNVTNLQLPYCFDLNVNVHNNGSR